MSATASWVTQVGIVAALRAASSVTSLLAQGSDNGQSSIVDEVVEGQLYPYIVVGEGTEEEELTFGQGGHIVRPEIFIYTQDGSSTTATTGAAGYKQGLAIAEAVAQTLENDGSFFAIAGHDVTDVLQEPWTKQRLDDPANVRAVMPKFEIHLEDQ
jgi:hypothetical protein